MYITSSYHITPYYIPIYPIFMSTLHQLPFHPSDSVTKRCEASSDNRLAKFQRTETFSSSWTSWSQAERPGKNH